MDSVLSSLLLDLNGLSDKDAEQKTFNEYVKLYLNKTTHKGRIGIHKTHDNKDVIFFEDRFDHAFFESAYKTSRQYNKGKFDRKRAVRIRWIGEILAGNIDKCEGYHLPSGRRDSSGTPFPQRLYVLWNENYVVWLEWLTKNNMWKFSSAYTASKGRPYIKSIVKTGVCFWQKNPVISRLTGKEAKS